MRDWRVFNIGGRRNYALYFSLFEYVSRKEIKIENEQLVGGEKKEKILNSKIE